MQAYQQAFLEFAIARQVLRFGEFTLKSGRQSPYFFNAGLFSSGAALLKLGGFYAAALQAAKLPVDMLFGPAYKGIPLVSATAIALAQHYDRDLPYAFNRKEAKAHGEGGSLVGAPLAGRVLLVDDVITAGTAVREALALVRQAGAEPVGVLIALNRQERGQGERSAIQELEDAESLRVISIVSLDELISYLAEQAAPALAQHLTAIRAYRANYGV